jgi:hypothetical protein
MGSSSAASNESPSCAVALDIEDFSRTVSGVPAGTSVGAGMRDELGDMPSTR